MNTNKSYLSNETVFKLAKQAVYQARSHFETKDSLLIYPVPRGGIPAAYAMKAAFPDRIIITTNPERADVIVDDIIDSGATRKAYEQYGKPFVALIDKIAEGINIPYTGWVVFPWEVKEDEQEEGIEENVRRILQHVEPTTSDREGLIETPKRVAKAWATWTEGYGMDAKDVLKVFEDGAEDYDEMVIVKDIPVYSKCEHHLADIFGTATVAYIPNGKIVGLSKISRLVNMYARRLQVQERLTVQIANALQEHLDPVGVGVIIKARHMCMESRGICQQGHHTITSALRGVIKTEKDSREEFMLLSK